MLHLIDIREFKQSSMAGATTAALTKKVWGYGVLLGSKLIMQTFLYNHFRIATLVARLIDNEVSFDIFSENLLLSARFMACVFLYHYFRIATLITWLIAN